MNATRVFPNRDQALFGNMDRRVIRERHAPHKVCSIARETGPPTGTQRCWQ